MDKSESLCLKRKDLLSTTFFLKKTWRFWEVLLSQEWSMSSSFHSLLSSIRHSLEMSLSEGPFKSWTSFPSLNLLFKMEFDESFSWSLTGPSTMYWWLRALPRALGLLPHLIWDCFKRRPLCTFLWYRFCSISSKLYFTGFWQSLTNAKDTTSFMAHRL